MQCCAEQVARCRGRAEEHGHHLACLRELLNAGGELKKKDEHAGHAAGIPANPYPNPNPNPCGHAAGTGQP